jgi:hypothetical protein
VAVDASPQPQAGSQRLKVGDLPLDAELTRIELLGEPDRERSAVVEREQELELVDPLRQPIPPNRDRVPCLDDLTAAGLDDPSPVGVRNARRREPAENDPSDERT